MTDIVEPFTRRKESISTGFSSFLSLTGLPPFVTGLEVPPLTGVTFRFLCAVADLTLGDSLVGMRQFATIGFAQLQSGEEPPPAPAYQIFQEVESESWHFSDVQPPRWIVTAEPLTNFVRQSGPFDQDSFIFRDTTGPALVYETATFPALPPLPGYLGLSSYTPPPRRGQTIALLRDVRYPLRQSEFFAIRFPILNPTRIRVYVECEQTNPSTRFQPDFATLLSAQQLFFVNSGMVPEEDFIALFPGAILQSVGASLILEVAA